MRNKFPGTCCRCGKHVAKGEGHPDLLERQWRVVCVPCVRSGAPDPARAAHTQRKREERERYARVAAEASIATPADFDDLS